MDPIISQLTDHLNRYMVFADEDQPLIMALWILHTWAFSESFPRQPYTTPYIYVHSATKQSGKTLLMDLVEPLVRNPERGVDYTPSTLFRLIESVSPTLMIDEVDAVWSGGKNESMRGVINGGYKRGGYVWRTENLEPTKFRTFSPKLFAGIDNGLLPDTIQDRCIPIVLKKMNTEEGHTVQTYYSYKVVEAQDFLVDAIDSFMFSHGAKIAAYDDPTPIGDIGPRQWEISMPLVQIAHGAKCEKQAREALSRLLRPTPEKLTPAAEVLLSIREVFEKTGADKLFSEDILAHLGSSWNGKLLGNRLRPFGIQTTTLRVGNRTLKGFYRHQFEDAWNRYL